MRAPETKQWTWILQQRAPLEDLSEWQIAEIYLNETEHAALEIFEGREVRKNGARSRRMKFVKTDIFIVLTAGKLKLTFFLGELWGLNLAKVYFENSEELRKFGLPPFAILEATENDFFVGANLVGKSFADVQTEFERSQKRMENYYL
jgi:hypothetical protein